MANALQAKFKELCLSAGVNLLTATVKVQLIDLAEYTYSAAHDYLNDVPSAARIGDPVTLTGKSVTGGVFDAADPAFAGLVAAPSIEALWMYVDTGDEATSPLVYFIDTASGLPIASGATGGTVAWSSGANKIFAL